MKFLKHLPNALTLSNLMMGTLAILSTWLYEYDVVLYLVAGCLVADILDGALARKLGVAGGLGIQLDSLADLVSFGVLPAVIIFRMHPAILSEPGDEILYMFLASTVAVSAGLRLARFNIDTRPREFFWGLATPAGGIMVTALGWSVFIREDFSSKTDLLIPISMILPVFLAILYQVPLKLPGLKSPNAGLYTLIAIAIFIGIGFIFWGPISIALGILLYVVAGLLNLLLKWY